MNHLSFFLSVALLGLMVSSQPAVAADVTELYEVRSYLVGETGDEQAIDDYLSQALLPALERQGIGPVGVFSNAPQDESGSRRIVVVIPYRDSDQIVAVNAAIANDSDYQQAAQDYLARDGKQAPYERIRSELLSAMTCWPTVKVPEGTLENDDRVYELRLYESATERLGSLKVDMFNQGEVPIFLDSGIQPIFIGQALVGPQLPSLTYLTVYANDQARVKAWDAFRNHPEWKVLSAEAKYQGTVSHIDKFVLQAKPYSQM